MTIFTAEAAFDTPTFIDSGSIAELFELGTVVAASASVFALEYSDAGTTELLTLSGSFGDYVDGYPTTGTISHIAFAVNGVEWFSFTNAVMTVAQFTAFVQADQIAQLFQALLSSADELRGSSGNDVLQGFAGDDMLTGGDGADTLDGGTGADVMIGGAGNDIYMIDQSGGAGQPGDSIVELAGEGIDELRTSINWGLGGTNVENITATGSGDIFLGGSEVANVMTGNVGNNYFVGDGGNDVIDGNAGRDIASFGLPAGTAGNLVLVDGTGADAGRLLIQLVDGANVQTVARVTFNGPGSAVIEGVGPGAFWGTDTVQNVEELHFLENTTDGSNATNIAIVNLTVQQYGDFVSGSDADDVIDLANYPGAINANGNRGNDTVSGTEAANNLGGGLGDDVLRGLGGNDSLNGDDGADTLEGGAGDDYLVGGAGNDSIDGGTGSNDFASFQLPEGTPGTLSVVDGSGADAGKLLVQITHGGVTQTFLRVTLTGPGGAIVEGVGIGAFMGTDTVANADQLHIFVNTPGGALPGQFVGINLTPAQFGNFVSGSELADTIDLSTYAGANDANGNRGDDVITGNANNNNLTGGAGNDTLDGVSGANDTASFQLPAGTLGTIAMVDGSGADAGKLLVQITNGGVTQTFLRITVTGQGSAIVEGVGIGAFLGTDTLSNIDQIFASVANSGPALPGQFLSINLSVNQFGNFVAGSESADVIDLANYAGAINANGNRGDDVITGTAAVNSIQGGAGNDTLSGLGGNDFLNGQAGDDTLSGGLDNDTLTGGLGSDTIDGDDGNDTLIGGLNTGFGSQPGDGADTLRGGAGNDVIRGGDGDDLLEGGDGDDNLRGDAGGDIMDGGAGEDFVSYFFSALTSGITFDARGVGLTGTSIVADPLGGTDTLISIEKIGVGGTEFDDIIYGSEHLAPVVGFANQLSGNGGNDLVYGASGNDFLDGGAGNDTLHAGAGVDVLAGSAGSDNLYGEAGDDFLLAVNSAPFQGATTNFNFAGSLFDGGDGFDFLTVGGFVNFQGTLSSIEGIEFQTAFTATLPGQRSQDAAELVISAATLATLPTNLTLIGQGVMTVDLGGANVDASQWVHASGSQVAVEFFGNNASQTMIGSAGNDRFSGGFGSDTFTGGAGSDQFEAGDGQHVVTDFDVGADLVDLADMNFTSFAQVLPYLSQVGNDVVFSRLYGGVAQTMTLQNVLLANLTAANFVFQDGTDNDTRLGTDQADELFGAAGNDVLEGYGGDDVLVAGDGNDTLRGGLGSDRLYGGDGNDFLSEASGDNGPFGNDLYDGGAGSDRVSLFTAFGPGVTVDLRVETAQDTGSMGVDTFVGIEHITANYGNDRLTGNDAANWFWTFSGSDILSGNGGNDYFTVGQGDKIADGGTGVDTIEISDTAFVPAYTSAGITLSLALQGVAQATGVGNWTLTNMENLGGSFGADRLTGDDNANILAGHLGNDTLTGGAGNDVLAGDGTFTFRDGAQEFIDITSDGPGGDDILDGGSGDDILIGGGGNDTLRGGLGSDQLFGGDGNDFLTESSGNNGPFGNDLYDGGAGNDRVSLFTEFGPGVTVDLRLTTAQNTGSMGTDTFVGIEHITANYGNDTLIGNEAANWFWTFSGSDNLSGNGGDDYFTVGQGDKMADGGAGVDTIEILDLAYQPAYTADGITVSLALQGMAQATGVGTWTLTNMENLGGSWGADELTGDANANILAGAEGNDTLVGGAGDDILAGDGTFDLDANSAPTFIAEPNWVGGNDRLEGGDGNDTLIGGSGGDFMVGGTGNDIYFVDQAGGVGVTGDSVIEAAGEGTDEIRTSIHWGLGGTNVENITATGTGDIFLGGSEVANVMTGNAGNNYIIGDGGNDSIDGAGGRDVASFNLPAGTAGTLTVVEGTGADAGKLLVQLIDGANVETVARVTLNGNGSATVEGMGTGAFWGTDTLTNIEELHFLENTSDGTPATNIAFIFSGVRQFGDFVEGSDTTDTIDLTTLTGALNVNGRRGDDTISGTEAVNNLSGGTGNDVLRGLGGNDSLNGDSGDDTLEGGADNDYIVGGAGNDSIDGGTGTNDVASYQLPTGTPGTIAVVDGTGADAGKLLVQITNGGVTQTFLRLTLTGSGGAIVEGVGIGAFMGTDTVVNTDQLHIFVNTPGGTLPGQFVAVNLTPAQFGNFVAGSENADVINLADFAGAVNANGNRGDDVITGTAVGNSIQGGTGNDTLSGLAGNDFLNGQNGDDTLFGGLDNDTLTGGGGSDTLDGGDGDDTLIGAFNTLGGAQPGDGADILRGGAGNDLIRAGDGDDVLEGGAGNDNLRGDLGSDVMDGGDGIDFVSFRFDDAGVTQGVNFDATNFGATSEFTFSDGRGGIDTIRNVEHVGVTGSFYDDVLRASAFTTGVVGVSYANQLYGMDGNDQVFGASGRDLLNGGIGNDIVHGLGGNDDMLGEAGDDVLDGGAGDDFMDGGAGADILEGRDGADSLIGGDGNDVLIGGVGSDFMVGDAGNDMIDGGTGADDVATFYLPANTVGTLRAVAGTGANSGRVFIERVNGAEVEVIAMITVTSTGAVVQGMGSAAFLGTDTLTNVDRILFSGVTADPTEDPYNPDQYAVVQLAAGIVSDGYVSGSTVYVDANNNGLFDVGEASTVTDAEGNFALLSTGGGTIRAVGGINVDTGLPNLLTLTAPEGSTVINPLTSLVQALVEQGGGALSIADAQDQVLASLGLDAGLDLGNVDIVQAGATDPAALNAQRAAVMIATILVGAGEAAGAQGAAAAIDAALQNLAGQVGVTDSQVDLTDSATIIEMVSAGLPDGTDIDDVIALLENATATISTAVDIAAIADAQQEAVIALDQTAPGGPMLGLDAASDSGVSSNDRITNDVTPTLSGFAEAGSTVRIFDASGQIGSTITNANGTWQFTVGALAAGAQQFRATATDASGNQSVETTIDFVIDTAVLPLGAPDLADASDSGVSPTDNLTNDDTPMIVGGGAEAGATVRLFASDGTTILGSAVADAGGNWSITSGALAQGTHGLTVRQTDLAGNDSTVSGELGLRIDLATTAPAVTSQARVYDSTPLLTGTAEAGASIAILDAAGAPVGTVIADQSGAWSFELTAPLAPGANMFGIIATDQAGNASAAVATTITLARLGSTLTGGAGNDALVGTADDDTLSGLDGSDVLTGGGGNDAIDGGAGIDTAIYSGLFRSYTVAHNGGSGTVAGGAEGGADTLTSIEVIEFMDGRFVFDADGFAAQVTRLYDTVLQRGPDQVGLDLWVDVLSDGRATLKDVANGFLSSIEFQTLTGNLTNEEYVEFLFVNALGRASDADGKAFWVGKLASGSDRADLLIGFSESLEHRAQTADLVDQGFFDTHDEYQAVSLMYDSFAGRQPDAEGLMYWSELLQTGSLTLDQVAAGFVNSSEFQGRIAGMSHAELVEFMYQNTLDRGADAAGRDYWVNALDNGLSDADLLLGFSQSYEHFNLLGEAVTNGIDYL